MIFMYIGSFFLEDGKILHSLEVWNLKYKEIKEEKYSSFVH